MGTIVKVKWDDLGDALDTKFMTSKSKKLIQDAWSGKEDAYVQGMCDYKWSNTRDYTMVLITLAPLALAQKVKSKYPDVDDAFKKLKKDQLGKLFVNIGAGLGGSIKPLLTNGAADTYKELFLAVLKVGSNQLSQQQLDSIWNGYVVQMGKMSRWIINKKYVNEQLKPLIDHMLPDVGDDFEKGVNKGAGGTAQKTVSKSVEPKKEERTEEEAKRKAAEEETQRKAEEAKFLETIRKIESYSDKRLVRAFKNMAWHIKWPMKSVVEWFERLVNSFTESKNHFEQYKSDHKFKSLYSVLAEMRWCNMGWQIYKVEKGSTEAQKFNSAVDFYGELLPFLGQVGQGDNRGQVYEYPTHNMLDRLKKCCDQLKIEFASVKTHPIFKDIGKVFLEFITQLSDELEKQLKVIPAKTEEQEKEKLRKIEGAYPKEQRYIPYKTPDKKRGKGFGSSAVLRFCWDRVNKRKVLLKYGSHVPIQRRKDLVKKFKEGKYKHIPQVDWYEDENGKFVFVIEYVSGAIPVFDYAKMLRNNRKALLGLCSQFLEASEEALQLDCFPETKGEHFLVDKKGVVKFIDIDDICGFNIEFVARYMCYILENDQPLKDEFLEKYNNHKNLDKSINSGSSMGEGLKGVLGLEDTKKLIDEMIQSQ